LTRGFEKSVIVERGIINNKICNIGVAPVFVGVNHCAVGGRGGRGQCGGLCLNQGGR
jgi:hypothetical protein